MFKTSVFKKDHVVNATVFTGADVEDDKDTKNVNVVSITVIHRLPSSILVYLWSFSPLILRDLLFYLFICF